MNLKKEIINLIDYNLDDINLEDLIIESVSNDKGDFSLPCFSLSKILHKNPIEIANEIATKVKTGTIIEKIEVVAGYLNFFLNKEYVSKSILSEISNVEYFHSSKGEGKIACVDYCSPNLAKFLHIGHLKSLIEGESLCRLLETNGYTVKRLDFTGDYGTPFGKIIAGMLKWGSLEEAKEKGNDALQEYYVKFNQAEAEDESLTQDARDIFKKIEEKDEEIYPIYKEIISIALNDQDKMMKLLGVEFDDYRGEMYYNDLVPEVVKDLSDLNLLQESEGAKIVDLKEFGLDIAVIIKNDGTTLYITRDLAAAKDRFKDYKFDNLFYITDVAQVLHFKQLIKLTELVNYNIDDKLEHVPYGRFSLPDGKISSRRGKQAGLVDLLEYALNKAKDVIKDRKFEIENPDEVANKVARAVLNYSVLKVERNKDCVFDVDKAFSFDGETAPYMQYTYTRLESVLRKYQEEKVSANYSCFDEDAFEIVKMVNSFKETLDVALEKRDASIVAKRVMEMCKTFNKFYTNNKILDGNSATTEAKINLVKALKLALTVGFNIICIDTLKEM